MASISVIIPLAPGEPRPEVLLACLPQEAEIILSQEGGRASSLNQGAAKASGEYLWFLHADSELTDDGWHKLQIAIKQVPNALHYFDLAFAGGSFFMRLNAWGANFRSRILGCPFGDQGFCLNRSVFEELGGYPKDVAYGEDHLFVWKARKAGVQLNPIGATLTTSPRKYEKYGWLRVTILHQYLWLKQVVAAQWK